MIEDTTIKISKTAYQWLRSRKEATGQSIKFIIELACDALNGKPIVEKKVKKS